MRVFLVFLLFFSSSVFCENFLTLDKSIEIAIKNNLDIKIAKNKIEQAYYEKQVAKTYFFPKITSSFNWTHLGNNEGITIPGIPIPPIKFTEDNMYTFTISLNQPIFTGRRIEKTYEITKENLENAKIGYEIQLQNLILNVKKGYFSILEAQKFLQTAKKYKELLKKHLEDAEKMFKQGLVTKLDILKTEVAVKGAETKITESENLIKIAKSNFNFILNKPVDEEFKIKDIFEEKYDKKNYQYWKKIAMENRPEIKSMEKIVSIYNKKIKIERSDLYPQVYLFTNYNYEKGTQNSPYEWDKNWNAGIVLSYDIWNWGETKNKIKKAEKEKKQMEKQLEIVKKSIELEVKNAYLNLLSAEKKIDETGKQVEAAEENLRVANLLYKEGMATTTDVIDAITSLTEAKNNYYISIYEYKIAYFQLEKATGIYTRYTKMEEK